MTRILFVAGGSGFIGAPFVRLAVQAGYEVRALARSDKSKAALRSLGAVPVAGDLLTPGAWQHEAAQAHYVMHLAQPPTFDGSRISLRKAQRYSIERMQMDTNLLGSLRPDVVKRIVYVSGTSYYGDLGSQTLHDETATPNPRGWGPFVVEPLRQLAEYGRRGLPIVEAFPGGVYGPGSWYAGVLDNLRAGKRLLGLRGPARVNSYVHYEDCARALLHLLEHGAVGQRYIVVDDRPTTSLELAERSAQAMGVPLRAMLLPRALVHLLAGPIIAESLAYEQRLSNARLHSTGFTFTYPTLAEGIPDAVARWRDLNREDATQSAVT